MPSSVPRSMRFIGGLALLLISGAIGAVATTFSTAFGSSGVEWVVSIPVLIGLFLILHSILVPGE